jgi:hypothetical protein
MRKTLVAATGIALALVAGCSSGKDKGGAPAGPAAAPGGKDTCGLVSDDQLTKAFGQKPSSHQASNDITNGCKWLFPNDNASLHIYVSNGAPDPRITEKGAEPVPGIGDKAGWHTEAGVMFAVAGSTNLQVIVGIGTADISSPQHAEREKQAGISVTRNAFASLGVGKPDDETVPGPSVTSTSPATGPSETSSPDTPTSETTSSDGPTSDTTDTDSPDPSGN